MDTKHSKFLALAGEFEKKKKEYHEMGERLAEAMADIGIGQYIQCQNTGAVYKIVEPSGTYVEYRKISYERTALPGEKRGSLAKSEAEEAGFVLRK